MQLVRLQSGVLVMLTASILCLLIGGFLLYIVSVNFDKIFLGRLWHVLMPIAVILVLCGASLLPWGIYRIIA